MRGHFVNTVLLTPVWDFPQKKFDYLTSRTKTNLYEANGKGKTKSTEPRSQGDAATCFAIASNADKSNMYKHSWEFNYIQLLIKGIDDSAA